MGEKSNTQSGEKIKKKFSDFSIVLVSLIATASILLEIYFLTNDVWNLAGIISAFTLTFISTAYLIMQLLKRQKDKEEVLKNWMSETSKAQKALYLLTKKNFSIEEKKFNTIAQEMQQSKEELDKTQKVVGKVLMNHFSEHADAMMNASGRILDSVQETIKQQEVKQVELKQEIEVLFEQYEKNVIHQFEETLSHTKEMQNKGLSDQENKIELLQKSIEDKYEKLENLIQEQVKNLADDLAEIKKIKDSIKSESIQLEHIEGTENRENVTQQETLIAESKEQEKIQEKEQEKTQVSEQKNEEMIQQVSEEATKQEEKNEVLKELDDDIIYNKIDLDDTGKQVSREELLESDFSTVEEKIKKNKEEFPSSIIEENDKEIKLVPLEEDVKEKEEKKEEAEPVKKSRKKKEETKEILTEKETEIEKEKEKEVEKEDKLEEAKPPMPDLSDANRKMTPEEIAALIANM